MDNFEMRGEIILPLEGFQKMNEVRLLNGEEVYMNLGSNPKKKQDYKYQSQRRKYHSRKNDSNYERLCAGKTIC